MFLHGQPRASGAINRQSLEERQGMKSDPVQLESCRWPAKAKLEVRPPSIARLDAKQLPTAPRNLFDEVETVPHNAASWSYPLQGQS